MAQGLPSGCHQTTLPLPSESPKSLNTRLSRSSASIPSAQSGGSGKGGASSDVLTQQPQHLVPVYVNDSTPEDGGQTPFVEKAKQWCERHKPKIRIVGAVTLAVGLGVVAHLVTRQDGERYDAEDIGDSDPVSGREATHEPRRSSLAPDRDPFLRRLPAGQRASEAAKARYKELTGNDLPPGYTLVRRWFYLSPGDEDPGEAAA